MAGTFAEAFPEAVVEALLGGLLGCARHARAVKRVSMCGERWTEEGLCAEGGLFMKGPLAVVHLSGMSLQSVAGRIVDCIPR